MTCGANSMHLCGRKGVLLPFLPATVKLPWKLEMKNSCYFCMPTKCPVPTGLFLKDTFLAGVEWKQWHICVFPPASIRSAFGCLGKEWNHNRAEGKQTKPILPGSSPCSPWSLQQESRARPAVGYSALSWISPGASMGTLDLQSCNGALTQCHRRARHQQQQNLTQAGSAAFCGKTSTGFTGSSFSVSVPAGKQSSKGHTEKT